MFEKFTKKLITDTKENVKEEIQKSVDEKAPVMLCIITAGFVLWSLFDTPKQKQVRESVTIIHNYYITNNYSR